jgi:predicted dehydrogenase
MEKRNLGVNLKESNLLHVGVIGAGRIVERVHLPLLIKMPEIIVVGIFDPKEQQASALANLFGIPNVCRSLEELFGLNLDIALVACPNHLHAQSSIAALEANIHVLCEKPMATSYIEAKAMVESAMHSGRELMIAFSNRFRPETLALSKLIQEGKLGKITSIRCGWLRHKGVPGADTWFTNRAIAGGGVLIDLGSHLIDLALLLSGRPQLLSCTSCLIDQSVNANSQASWYLPTNATSEANCDVEISASAFAVFDGPLDLFIEVSWDRAVPQDITYLNVQGVYGLAQLETLFGLSPAGQRPERPLRIWIDNHSSVHEVAGSTSLLQPFQSQWEFFIRSISSGQSLRSQLQDSLATVQIVEAMYASAIVK